MDVRKIFMNWYFWLNEPYKQIINQYQSGYQHHSLIFNSNCDLGSESLIWGISRWLLCNNTQGIKSCNLCDSCKLMQAKTHPDWYHIESKKDENFINIDIIHNLTEKIYQSSQQGGNKIVWFSNINKLTELSIHALLKIIEEPPNNSWFFFSCNNFSKIPLTLRSRCIFLNLFPPIEKDSFIWLQKKLLQQDDILLSAIRVNYGSPLAALKLLTSNDFQYRKKLYNNLLIALNNNQMISLLPIINNDLSISYINWLILIILDAIKLQNNCSIKLMINCDFINLIKLLSSKVIKNGLFKIIDEWCVCRENLIFCLNINKEILIIKNLLLWQKLILVN